MRHLALAVALAASTVVHPALAQVRVHWGTPEDQPLHTLSFGVGSEVGMLGIRYVRYFPSQPVALWGSVGLGAAGLGAELTMPTLRIGAAPDAPPPRLDVFLSAGLTTQYAGVSRPTGTWLLLAGLRRWGIARAWFTEVAVGQSGRLWGAEPWSGPMGLAMRLQFGTTF